MSTNSITIVSVVAFVTLLKVFDVATEPPPPPPPTRFAYTPEREAQFKKRADAMGTGLQQAADGFRAWLEPKPTTTPPNGQ